MAGEKFGVAVDEQILRGVDDLAAECGGLGVSHSEIVRGILIAFVHSGLNHTERVRKFIGRK
jgi:hypothetical protein